MLIAAPIGNRTKVINIEVTTTLGLQWKMIK